MAGKPLAGDGSELQLLCRRRGLKPFQETQATSGIRGNFLTIAFG
ncbi:MAG: hypothetical protein VX438_17865 [Planctomycetota bacterium]|nr:hypothetical protein [Planctomycetota bacterium]